MPIPGLRAHSFAEQFEGLTGHSPFPWQERLYSRFVTGDWPAAVSLPTAAGKTSIMAIWLVALAYAAEIPVSRVSIPRRLVWIVNRRVVVDQATSEAERLASRIADERIIALEAVRRALKGLAAVDSEDVLAISTLRGQFADNTEWRNDPARPSIVVGTVDMIGSRILFSGYGLGFRSRPLHAGFLTQDSLFIHDEAHLEPAFQSLIESIRSEQRRRGDFRPMRAIPLTATSRDGNEAGEFTLGYDDQNDQILRGRIHAEKEIAFHPVSSEESIAGEVLRHALEFQDTGRAILVFLRRLKDVDKVCKGLKKATKKVVTLTGTLRGFERDDLAHANAVFARFLPDPKAQPESGTVYLVCTSAGEVGMNISADHLVCDLTPFDSMAQRLGRVNRFGEGHAHLEVVFSEFESIDADDRKDPERLLKRACESTLTLLKALPIGNHNRHDGSPAALSELLNSTSPDQRAAAFTPSPLILAATDVLFDSWALTSVRDRMPGRPPVADWLHGISEWQAPETYVAWREEVEVITPELLETYAPEDLLDEYPLKPHELLRDTSVRVAKQLIGIAERVPDKNLWVVMPDGTVQEPVTLAELAIQLKAKNANLKDCTVLLPPSAGGLRDGMLDGEAPFNEQFHNLYDVSDRLIDERGRNRRCRRWDHEKPPSGMRLIRSITVGIQDGQAGDNELSTKRSWNWYVLPTSSDDDGSRTASGPQELGAHQNLTRDFAERLTRKLVSETEEARAVILAAGWHDLGKRRSLWQRSIGNYDSMITLAKSGGTRMLEITGYRHEFGSVLDVEVVPEFQDLKPQIKELVLHLIAAHHGRGRPHFSPQEAFDPDYTDAEALRTARSVTRRYALLQRRYGRWGLAYLESLVRTADALASQSYRTECSANGASQ